MITKTADNLAIANDPLGCENVEVIVTRTALIWKDHKGKHPQSTRCHWSDKEIMLDQIGDCKIDVRVMQQ